jgi:hypothetical protein
VLTKDDARAIYQVKNNGKGAHDAARLAEQYGITAKAIRDIWSHRTWVLATVTYWTHEQVTTYVHKRLCAGCRNAGINFDHGTACLRCMRSIRRIRELRAGGTGPQSNGAAATVGEVTVPAAIGNDSAGPSLRRRSWNEIWLRQNSIHEGLLQEALDSM